MSLFALTRCIHARLSRIVIVFREFNGRAQSIVILSLSLSLSLFRGSLHYPLFYYRNSQLAGSFLRDVAQREGETGFSSGERERERERERESINGT